MLLKVGCWLQSQRHSGTGAILGRIEGIEDTNIRNNVLMRGRRIYMQQR
jgi:hypothetical protein